MSKPWTGTLRPDSSGEGGYIYSAESDLPGDYVEVIEKSAHDAKCSELSTAVSSLEQMRTEMERVVRERDGLQHRFGSTYAHQLEKQLAAEKERADKLMAAFEAQSVSANLKLILEERDQARAEVERLKSNVFYNRSEHRITIEVGPTRYFIGKNQGIDLDITPLKREALK